MVVLSNISFSGPDPVLFESAATPGHPRFVSRVSFSSGAYSEIVANLEKLKDLEVEDSDPFVSPKVLLCRSYRHILDAITEINRLAGSEAYTEVLDYDAFTDEDVYKIAIKSVSTLNLAAIIKDAAGNLRDCLDHTVYACASILKSGEPEKTAFPIAKTANDVLRRLKSKELRDVPAEIHSTLIAFFPYERSDGLLYALNQLRNHNTHRKLILTCSYQAISQFHIDRIVLTRSGQSVQACINIWHDDRSELEHMRVPHGTKFAYDVGIETSIRIQGIKGLGDLDVIQSLCSVAREVDAVIQKIATETMYRLKPGPEKQV